MRYHDGQRFQIKYTGHEIGARKLLLDKNIKTAEELAIMSTGEIEDVINEVFVAYYTQDDWILVYRYDVTNFDGLTEWVER